MKDFLISTFPNYTEQMYEGNQPAGKGHELTNGGCAERWSCWYGCGETSGESVLWASITINHKINLFVCDDTIRITDIRYSGKSDVWEFCNNGKITFSSTLILKCHLHSLEDEKIERILASEFPGRFWQMVQKRALELYNETKLTQG